MLEERLKTVGKLVDQDDKIADVGTDHAYLPILLLREGKIKSAVASDIGEGPTQNARDNVAKYGLASQIDVRLGAGLEPLNTSENIDTVIIAGMGGKLITDILEAGYQANKVFPKLILEPNVGEPTVRQWLNQHQYQIVAEEIITEDGHTYEIIKAVKGDIQQELTRADILLGLFLRREQNQVFITKWHNNLIHLEKLLVNLQKAKNPDEAKILQVKADIAIIKEVI